MKKEEWKIAKFGDVVKHVKDRITNMDESGLTHYLGGEHFTPGELHVNGRGIIEGSTIGPAFIMRFKPGQMLYVSRNPHLKKAAIAEFEGLCSNTTYVCEAVEKHLIPELLPFIMQSDGFWNFAERNKRGSTNPYLNWKDIAGYEFPLPPKDEQRRIAEILWAVDILIESWKRVKDNLVSSKNAILNNTLLINSESSKWKIVPLKQVAKIQTGIAKGKSYKNTKMMELPYLRVANVQDGYLDLSEIKTINISDHEIERYTLKYGDVLLTEGGDFDKLGRGTIWREEIPGCLHQNHVFSVRTNTDVLLPDFLSYQTASLYGRRYFLKCSKKTSNLASINSTQVKGFPVLLPSISEQQELINILSSIEEQESRVNGHLFDLENLKKSLVGEIFIQ